MATKLYDLVVKTGEFESQGKQKNTYKKIAEIYQSDNGEYALIESDCLSMQLNYTANKGQKEKIIGALFKPRTEGRGSTPRQSQNDFDDKIPF